MAPSTFAMENFLRKDRTVKRKRNIPKLNLSKLNQNNQKRPRLNSAGSSCSSDSDSNCSSGSSVSSGSDLNYEFSFKKTMFKPEVRLANYHFKETNEILDTIRRETSVPACITPIPTIEEKIEEEDLMEVDKEETKEAAQPETPEKKEDVDNRSEVRRSPNGFLLAAPLPKGEILLDNRKQQWRLGKTIGCGGFGEIYLASRVDENGEGDKEDYVIKLEPHDNGPLFVEINFYCRAAKEAQIAKYAEERQDLKHLGVPSFVASGSHHKKVHKYRFLVMRRYGVDLQKILDSSIDRKFPTKTLCAISLQVLDSLEYMHNQGYVHKDIKGANLLVGATKYQGKNGQHQVNLVDFGLSAKFRTLGHLHKQYVHDERWAHEGTLEYTSRDAHIGCASRRGDLEIMVYNLVEWAGGVLPWDRDTSSCEEVKAGKFWAFANIDKFLKTSFKDKSFPKCIEELMKYVNRLHFEDPLNYEVVRNIFKKEVEDIGLTLDGKLDWNVPKEKKELVDTEDEKPEDNNELFKKQKGDDDARVSMVFDKQCVQEDIWMKKRDNIITKIAKESMENPTQAMIDLAQKIKKKQQVQDDKVGGKIKKRHLSRRWSTDSPTLLRGTSVTPAMEDVLKLCKIPEDTKPCKISDEPQEFGNNFMNMCKISKDPQSASMSPMQGAILPSGMQLFGSMLSMPISLDDTEWPTTLPEPKIKMSKIKRGQKTGPLSRVSHGRVGKGTPRELRNLNVFLPNHKTPIRRTRSALETPKRQLRLQKCF